MKNAILGLLLALGAVAGLATEASADSVSFFNDASYVDTGTEAANMSSELTGLGHTPANFVGTGDAAWTAAMAANDCLVIPELEVGNLGAALSATTLSNIATYVFGGGRLVVAGSHTEYGNTLLNSIFGWSLSQNDWTASGSTSLNAGAAAGTAFAGGPGSLSNLNGTALLATSSLPGGALNLYSNGANTSVFQAAHGSGRVTFLGYDWFDGTNASWGAVLDSSLVKGGAVPEPGSLALLGLGLLGLGLGVRRRRSA